MAVVAQPPKPVGYSDEIVKGVLLQMQQQGGVDACATAAVAAPVLPTSPATSASATGATTAAVPSPGGGGGGAKALSLLPLLLDSVPFMVTVIAQSSARVLYQNGPSKTYHGAYHPETSGAGDDFMRDLFSMGSEHDHDQLLKVGWIIIPWGEPWGI